MIDLLMIMDLIDDPERACEFERMYKKYQNLFMGIAESRVHNRNTAEECVQDAMIIVGKKFNELEDVKSKQAINYFCSIVRNVSIDRYKHEAKRLSFSIDDADESLFRERSSSDFFESIEILDLALMMEKLSEEVQTYLIMYYVYGYSLKEISKERKISYYLLKKNMNDAVKTLEKELKKNDE